MFVCLILPSFRLQAALRWIDRRGPAAVVDEDTLKGVVLEVNQEAAAQGIAPGMTSSQAMARHGNILLRPRSPAQEQCLNQLLIETALAISPNVEITRAGACTADLRQAAKATCWQRLADEQVGRLGGLGLRAVAGIAPTPDLADLAARGATPSAVVYDAASFVAALPVEALEPSESLRQILRDWGIRSVGDFLALPVEEVTARLGPEAQKLRKRVSARNKRLLRLVRPAPEYAEAFDFEYEVETVEPVLFLLRRFLMELCDRLRTVYRVARTVSLSLPLEDGASHERVFGIPAPTADVDVLFRIVHTHLESLQLPQRITGVRLRLEAAASSRDQLRLFESALRDPNQFGETLARLKALLGNNGVGVPARCNTHRPDSWTVSDCFPEETAKPQVSEPLRGLPLRRYRPPRDGAMRMEKGTPGFFDSSAVRGVVQRAFGPYRASGNWWDGERWDTEEWDVEFAEGGLYRLSRRGDRWMVEGCYEVC